MELGGLIKAFRNGYRNVDDRNYCGMLRDGYGFKRVINTVRTFNEFDSNYPKSITGKLAYFAGEGTALLRKPDDRIYETPKYTI